MLFLYGRFRVVEMCKTSNIIGGARRNVKENHNSPVGGDLSFPHTPNAPRQPIMPLEGMHSDELQQLGVSYTQLIDYSSMQYAATLVSPSRGLQTVQYSDRGRFKSVFWY